MARHWTGDGSCHPIFDVTSRRSDDSPRDSKLSLPSVDERAVVKYFVFFLVCNVSWGYILLSKNERFGANEKAAFDAIAVGIDQAQRVVAVEIISFVRNSVL